ncbi:MAG: hypothetical protein GY729_12515 [Desulfobacteraceae bacterium]|nr:hypothetical protein [Desulfobacteraceae bacterium]
MLKLPKFTKHFVQSLDDFNGIGKGDTIILSGDLVLATLEKSDNYIEEGYILQKPRRISLVPDLKNKKFLYLWVKEQALSLAKQIKNVHLVLAHDYYLRAGFLKHKRTVFLAGGASDYAVNLEILMFEKGVLQDCRELTLERHDTPEFTEQLLEHIHKIKDKWPEARIEWHDPLPEMPSALKGYRIKKAGPLNFLLPTFQSVENGEQKPSYGFYVLAGSVTFFFLTAYVLLLMQNHNEYKEKVHYFKRAIKGYEKIYAKGDNNLDMLEKQRSFLDETKAYNEKTVFMSQILSYFIKKDIKVRELKMVMKTDPDMTVKDHRKAKKKHRKQKVKAIYDFEVVIHLPKPANPDKLNGLQQINPVMEDMTKALGVNLDMKVWKESTLKGFIPAQRRVYKLHGTIISTRKTEKQA